MRRGSLLILKACSYIFYLICASGSHVTWNFAVPDPNVWCCILLFLCTLDDRHDSMMHMTSSPSLVCLCGHYSEAPSPMAKRRGRHTEVPSYEEFVSDDSEFSKTCTSWRNEPRVTGAINDIIASGHLEIAFAVPYFGISTLIGENNHTVYKHEFSLSVGVEPLSMTPGVVHVQREHMCENANRDSAAAEWRKDILPLNRQPWLDYLGTCATSHFDRDNNTNMCSGRLWCYLWFMYNKYTGELILCSWRDIDAGLWSP